MSNEMTRERIRELMSGVKQDQGGTLPDDDQADLRAIGFRSVDFSDLALRVESEIGREIDLTEADPSDIRTVDDVLTFFTRA